MQCTELEGGFAVLMGKAMEKPSLLSWFYSNPTKAFLGTVLIVVFLLLISWHFVPSSTQPHFGIMIDAGSSHTAVSLFTWSSDMKNFTTLSWKKDVTPGISSFANNLDGLSAYVKPLISFAADVVCNYYVYIFDALKGSRQSSLFYTDIY